MGDDGYGAPPRLEDLRLLIAAVSVNEGNRCGRKLWIKTQRNRE